VEPADDPADISDRVFPAEQLQGRNHCHVMGDGLLKNGIVHSARVVGSVGQDIDSAVDRDLNSREAGGMGEHQSIALVGYRDRCRRHWFGHWQDFAACDPRPGEQLDEVGSALYVGFRGCGRFGRIPRRNQLCQKCGWSAFPDVERNSVRRVNGSACSENPRAWNLA